MIAPVTNFCRPFTKPLVRGRLLRRYKRFLADVELESGEVVTAHCANSGSMLGCNVPGSDVLLSYHDDPRRKLRYGWEAIHIDGNWIGVNTGLPNLFVGDLLRGRQLEAFACYDSVKPEARLTKETRLDFYLEGEGLPPAWVEVKNVTLRRGDTAIFPDSVTQRGAKHMRELGELAKQGARAAVVFTVQRVDCERFAPAEDIDPAYAEALREAVDKGVEVHAIRIRVDERGHWFDGLLPTTFGNSQSTITS